MTLCIEEAGVEKVHKPHKYLRLGYFYLSYFGLWSNDLSKFLRYHSHQYHCHIYERILLWTYKSSKCCQLYCLCDSPNGKMGDSRTSLIHNCTKGDIILGGKLLHPYLSLLHFFIHLFGKTKRRLGNFIEFFNLIFREISNHHSDALWNRIHN